MNNLLFWYNKYKEKRLKTNNKNFEENEKIAKQLDKKIKINNNKDIDKRKVLLNMIKIVQKAGIEIPNNINSLKEEELEKILENIVIEKK